MIFLKRFKVALCLSLLVTFFVPNSVYAFAGYSRDQYYREKQEQSRREAEQVQAIRSKVEACTRAIAANPQDVDAYFNRGRAYLQGNYNYNGAIADFTKVLELNPKMTNAYFNRAVAYQLSDTINNSKCHLAIADYTKYIEVNPGDKQAYYNRGLSYIDYAQNKLAMADFDKVLSIDPGNQDALKAKKSLLEIHVKVDNW